MTAPRWAATLLRRLSRATGAEADVLIGDLEEAHRAAWPDAATSSRRC